jgi:predicted alpha/beta-hydrolase family hydrolase
MLQNVMHSTKMLSQRQQSRRRRQIRRPTGRRSDVDTIGEIDGVRNFLEDRLVSSAVSKPISIAVNDAVRVSGLLQTPGQARAYYVLAHGAGAGMNHPFMVAVAAGLARRGIATVRYQFPYMERRAKRPDPPQLAQATVRAAVAAAGSLLPELPLIAGGKSFGGRMTSQAQAKRPLPGVCGLAFLGFPLHPACHPSLDRAEHLFDVRIPMLFLQGTRDSLASLDQIEPLCKKLGRRATLKLFADADHSFHVPARTGRKDAQVFGDVLDALSAWVDSVIIPRRKKS